MKTIISRIFWIFLTLLILGFFALNFFFYLHDTVSKLYSAHKDIPEHNYAWELPNSSFNILTRYNLDMNYGFGTFNFQVSQISQDLKQKNMKDWGLLDFDQIEFQHPNDHEYIDFIYKKTGERVELSRPSEMLFFPSLGKWEIACNQNLLKNKDSLRLYYLQEDSTDKHHINTEYRQASFLLLDLKTGRGYLWLN